MENPLLSKGQFAQYNKIKPEHFVPATKEILDYAKKENKKHIDFTGERTFDNTLVPEMEISEEVSRVVSPMSQLYSTMTSDEINEEFQKAIQLLTEFGNEMSMDPDNYKMYKDYAATAEAKALTGEKKRHLDNTMKGFILAGAELNDEDKAKLKEINLKSSELSLKFSNNVVKSNFELVVKDKKDLAGLPEDSITGAREKAIAMKIDEGDENTWVFNLDMPSFLPFMKFAENVELKEKLWRAYFTRGTKEGIDNRPLIQEIVKLKKEKANLLGFDTYGQLSLERKMAESPEIVMEFLDNIAIKTEDVALEEFNEIKALKEESFGEKFETLMPWETSYWTNKLKEKKYSFNENEVSEYFSADETLQAFYDIAKKLYGIKFEKIDNIPVWHKDVQTFKLVDENDELRSYVYVDLYPRSGQKRPGAWMSGMVSGMNYNGKKTIPQVGVHCNFTPPVGDKPALLRYDEVTTLFHEFGHALHGALSQTKFTSTSGTHVKWDVVELPSSFHENFVKTEESLKMIAKHYKTGEPMPKELMDKLLKANDFMRASDARRQITFGMFDMTLHHTENMKDEMTSAHEISKKMMVKYNNTPYIDDSYFEAGFSHIFAGGYAAGYYSYMWANILDADAFSLFQEKDSVLNREAGKKFMENILEKGDSEDMNVLFEKFRGRPVSDKALLERLGIK
ncbi:MAG: M3 family metallopeptidase [Candidatus Delongbacteria bacterium]|jgi:peptidyl-dipeptidase Dcp|nr:M3 family metallopeptidase [Candidatus Delongbacteria bacterium]